MRVAYLGPPGTFSHEALRAVPGAASWKGLPQASLHDAVRAVDEGTAERALVPIENALEGGVNATLDALAFDTEDVVIVGEVVHPVRFGLIAREDIAPEAVRTVVSFPQASGQCARFLHTRLRSAVVVPAASTADAVRAIADGELPAGATAPHAALGNRLAAELYGCRVVVDGVEDAPGNETRFVWLARTSASSDEPPAGRGRPPGRGEPHHPAGAWKTSLVFWGAGSLAAGWLVRCLSEFAFRGVNLTRIESRPLKRRLGSYVFFVDCEGAAETGPVAEAIGGLRGQAEVVRVLGSYPAAG